MDLANLQRQYRDLLLDDIAPFWLRHGVDRECGGVLTCMADDGTIISQDKYIWSQARSVWTFSALYNRVHADPDYLDAARNSLRFLLQHGRDQTGRWVYRTDRRGVVIEGPISIYSDCFVVYGCNEYYRATQEASALALARSTFEDICRRVDSPDFRETAPYALPAGQRPHAVPMMLLHIADELFVTTADDALEGVVDTCLDQIMHRFLRRDRGLSVELLTRDWQELPPPEGTAVMPGHAIEAMWFVLHVARRRGDTALIREAADAIRRHLEAGWDNEYGGILLGIDADGGTPAIRNWEKKAWWPHTEALYALLLARQLTGESRCEEWYRRVHDWAFAHYPAPGGEWRQRLTREGRPTTEVIGLPVKDPFHLPRAAILITQLCPAKSQERNS
jgi:N-acylglucosamine 2-epimerase